MAWCTPNALPLPVRVEKRVAVGGGRLDAMLRVDVSIENESDRPLRARLAIEWATTMLGGGGNTAAWWEVAGERSRHDGRGVATAVERLGQGNHWLGIAIATTVVPAADAWWAPIETVSNSEAGFERVYQGSALLLSWAVDLPPGGRWSAPIEHQATSERDPGSETPSARGLRPPG